MYKYSWAYARVHPLNKAPFVRQSAVWGCERQALSSRVCFGEFTELIMFFICSSISLEQQQYSLVL